MTRPTYDQTYLSMLPLIGQRSTCDRGKPACILAKGDRIIATGYAGSPPGLEHCDDVGHLMEFRSSVDYPLEFSDYELQGVYPEDMGKYHCIRTVHAEANAIAQCARMGHSTEGATAYVTMTPCRDCAKLLIAAGIKRVVCAGRYHVAELSEEWFAKAGVVLEYA